jgi:hypothetical protein
MISGPSLDQATISGPDSETPYYFVEKPDAQQFSGLINDFQGNYLANTYPKMKNNKIKKLKEILNNNQDVHFILDKKPNLKEDDNLDDNTLSLLKELEEKMEEIIKSNCLKGMIVKSSESQFLNSLSITANFKKSITKTDDRLFNLTKMLINK